MTKSCLWIQTAGATVAGLVLSVVAAAGQAGPVPVEAEPVRVERVIEEATAIGTLISAESVTISPEIAGRISSIAFTEGSAVREGDVLFQLDSTVHEAELIEAQANHELRKRNFERADGLLQSRAGTARARDEALSELQVAEALLTLAQSRLDKMRIVAPFDGIVGLRNVSVGEYVQPGQKLVNLEKIDPIKVDFSVAERYLPHVRSGARIQIKVDALGERTFTGEVYAINPQIDPAGRSIALRAVVPNPDGILRPGLFARVLLETQSRDSAIVASEDAIVADANGTFVYRVIDGKAVRTPVVLGQRRFGQVEIREGLAEGDVVIVAGQIKIRDGAAVAPVMREAPAHAASAS
ncbi:membrane fusion protein (multidrug efflux system) [Tepidamorphus gemmatus]|uniref:Membrane fusion protein (Multidrug efflux system) n=1 Tax=Tepidamorphus gemmatus TaxID=747076 RepID=A0A4R3LXR0_9HYPH|nr:efflux RND transporter periplasmic adaptor subunit [Tepidamorphus gemmatus]TCT05444.1 membrane fusion protein (multidrug efflux system) [Tepidamorphus gemmatus]